MYQAAVELGAKLGRAGFSVITGGGPGIMEAGNRGARESGVRSIGLNIELPFEQHVNPYVAPDYLQQDFAATSTYGYLQDVSPVSEMEQFIHAILPDEDAQQHLDVGPAVACLLLRRRTWSGRTIATRSRLIYPGNRYYLSSRVQVD